MIAKPVIEIEVICGESSCEDIENRFSDIVGTDYGAADLRDRLRFKIIDGFFNKFEFKILMRVQVFAIH